VHEADDTSRQTICFLTGAGKMRGLRVAATVVLVLWLTPFLLVVPLFCARGYTRGIVVEGRAEAYADLPITWELRSLREAIPSSAQDIQYSVRPCWPIVHANFALSEAQFLDWCRSRAWEPIRLQASCALSQEFGGKSAEVLVNKGYRHDECAMQADNPHMIQFVMLVVYDGDSARVYYSYVGGD
jgi:hypothetical protein